MTTWIFYTDESYDENFFCLSAIGIKDRLWSEAFSMVRDHRKKLRKDYGLLLSKEIHAHKFVAGRGRPSSRQLTKHDRSRIFHSCLQLVSRLPEVMLFNICIPQQGNADTEMTAWNRLMNRIERTMKANDDSENQTRGKIVAAIKDKLAEPEAGRATARLLAYKARAIIMADQGRENDIEKAIRKMRRHNFMPSQHGTWPDGSSSKNIPLERIIEDPVFKRSDRSFLIQLADCVAFSLLRKEAPTEKLIKYGYDKMFESVLANVCMKKAARADPLGIVRK